MRSRLLRTFHAGQVIISAVILEDTERSDNRGIRIRILEYGVHISILSV
jgi:hypothetical protein